MAWLLDTNVLSELRRSRPNLDVKRFVTEAALRDLYVSSVCFAEIRFGIANAPDSMLRTVLTDWLSFEIRPMFTGRVLEISENVLLRWRLLIEQGRKAGRTYSQPDLLLAATALERA